MKYEIDRKKLEEIATIRFVAEFENEKPEDHFEFQEHIDFARSCDYYPHPGWFCAVVHASYAGIDGDAEYLGCCSYETYEQFKDPADGYYADMASAALDNLQARLLAMFEALAPLVVLTAELPPLPRIQVVE